MYRVGLNTAITLYRKSKRTINTTEFDTVQFKIKADEYDDTEEQQLKLLLSAHEALTPELQLYFPQLPSPKKKP